ncbi:MAG: hypothetical protein Q8L13_12520 [Bradyrhizobium sp.]|uniref:hypothetical protein n=1 Tax=Bradyrhizobium sp. TaxID=376 RepID=UPI002730E2CA|nr:hypothetical protein [Bradyrhizobium sp.]MDP1867152.1 hypothetical protein [Bradyrhizobium sp.]
MTRITTIIALTCFLVFGATATSILGRDSVPGARLEMAAAALAQGPVSNKAAKQDKLTVAATFALASFGPPQDATLSAPLRQAFAAAGPADLVPPPAAAPQAPQKPKLVAKPQPPVQKPYALLSDAQIAGIKERLKLSSSQESYWPAVETALRGIARKIHVSRKTDPGALIDPDAEEVQQLKSAAMPLLFQLREDQKREVRTLARIIGLEKVASMI